MVKRTMCTKQQTKLTLRLFVEYVGVVRKKEVYLRTRMISIHSSRRVVVLAQWATST